MTAHNEAKKEDIAKIVLMPGDPLRAKYIAETFLENYRLINTVRNMFGYTGFYKGKEVTVMSSGMGIPSMGIYSYELFKFYDVDKIIRIGSAGAYKEDLKLYDLVLVKGAYSESTYGITQSMDTNEILYSDEEINEKIENTAKKLNLEITKGLVHSSDVFYKEPNMPNEIVKKYNLLAVEMETFALFHNANVLNKKAGAILTISDNLVTHEETTSEERQKSFNDMIRLALETSLEL